MRSARRRGRRLLLAAVAVLGMLPRAALAQRGDPLARPPLESPRAPPELPRPGPKAPWVNPDAPPGPTRTPTVQWLSSWPRVQPLELGATAAMFAAAAIVSRFEGRAAPSFNGGILFDDAVRTSASLGRRGRQGVSVASDLFAAALAVYPMFDAAYAMSRGGESLEAGWQMMLINLEALAFTESVTALLGFVARRHDPGAPARAGPGPPRGADQGFISRNTALAFTGAGLTCAHHSALPLYGGGIADDIACGASLLAAVTGGAAQILAGRDYATDVLAGAGLGLLSGFVMPNVLHYGFQLPALGSGDGTTVGLKPGCPGTIVGLTLVGMW